MRNLLKYLSSLSFVILFLPFFDMCGTSNMDKTSSNVELQGISISNNIRDSVNLSKKTILEDTSHNSLGNKNKNGYEDFILNGYQMGLLIVFSGQDTTNKTNAKAFLSNMTHPTNYAYYLLSIIIILSFIVLICAFKNKIKTIRRLTYVNLILLICSIFLLIFFNQAELKSFKIGYYLLLLNFLAILFFLRKKFYLTKVLVD